MNNTLTLMIYQ